MFKTSLTPSKVCPLAENEIEEQDWSAKIIDITKSDFDLGALRGFILQGNAFSSPISFKVKSVQ